MHIGPYDNEPETVELMHELMKKEVYKLDISDIRKTAPEKLKTIIRHPIRKK